VKKEVKVMVKEVEILKGYLRKFVKVKKMIKNK
jgi:hypothetical protein